MILLKVVSFPFIAVAIVAVLIVYGSDEAERVADSYRDFFRGL